jgi:iron(III) transport system ATP-binding protein
VTPIAITGLVKSYDGTTRVLDGIDLTIEPGELFFLLGGSGCGKTTLLRLLAGFLTAEQGTIRFGEREVSKLPPERRDIGMVFQNYALWPHLDVAANVAFGLEVRRVSVSEREQRVHEALAMVGLGSYAKRRIGELSGGQQQRVALARALVLRPAVLLLDEPLSNLDAKLRIEMRQEIRRLCKQSGLTTVYVTHDQSEALSTADRIALLADGRVAQVGTPRELYHQPRTEAVATFVGEANLLDRVRAESFAGGTIAPGEQWCVRPEHLRLGSGTVQATITEASFQGDRSHWWLECQGMRLQAVEIGGHVREIGTNIAISVDPAHLIALEA